MIIAFSQANISNRKDKSRDEDNLFCFAHKNNKKKHTHTQRIRNFFAFHFFVPDVRRRFDKIDALAKLRLDMEDAVPFVVVDLQKKKNRSILTNSIPMRRE